MDATTFIQPESPLPKLQLSSSQLGETTVVAVRNDSASFQALQWSLIEFRSRSSADNAGNFVLLHVVTDVEDSKASKKVRVSEASGDMVSRHVRDSVLPFLESMQEMCDFHQVMSSIEVIKDDLCPESIIAFVKRSRADKLVLGGSENTTTWGTIAFCTANGKAPGHCKVVVVTNGYPTPASPETDHDPEPWTPVTESNASSETSSPGRSRLGRGSSRLSDAAQSLMRGGASLFSGRFRKLNVTPRTPRSVESSLADSRGSSPGRGAQFWRASMSVTRRRGEGGIVRGESKGRILLYSMPGCQGSQEVKAIFRRKGVCYHDLPLNLFPERRRELEQRFHRTHTPQLVFNSQHIGDLDALLALEQQGELDAMIEDVYETEPSPSAPKPPSDWCDSHGHVGAEDDLDWLMVQRMRAHFSTSDIFSSLQLHRRCFQGRAALDWIQKDSSCKREEAHEIARRLLKKCYFHQVPKPSMPLGVFREHKFEDSSGYYKFTEDTSGLNSGHCVNFTGSLHHSAMKAPNEVAEDMADALQALLDEFATQDGRWIDYRGMIINPIYHRFRKKWEDLHRLPLSELTLRERLSLLLNVHNILVVHLAATSASPLDSHAERLKLFGRNGVLISGFTLSVSDLEHCIHHTQKKILEVVRKTAGTRSTNGERSDPALVDMDLLAHFGMSDASVSGPGIRSYRADTVFDQLRENTETFFRSGGIFWDELGKQVTISKVISRYEKKFSSTGRDLLGWISQFLEKSERQDLQRMVNDINVLKVTFQEYDWRMNSWE